jgi:hypothetical protein
MSTNYNASVIGTPYVRATNISIDYSENGIATVVVEQSQAVVLADGTVAEINPIAAISFVLDVHNNGSMSIPLVDPTSGANLGASTTLQSVMLGILGAIRQQQLIQNP